MKKVKKKTDFMPNEYSKLFCKIFDDDINSEYWYLLVELVDLGYDSNSFNKIKKMLGYLENNARDFYEKRRVIILKEYIEESYYYYSINKDEKE